MRPSGLHSGVPRSSAVVVVSRRGSAPARASITNTSWFGILSTSPSPCRRMNAIWRPSGDHEGRHLVERPGRERLELPGLDVEEVEVRAAVVEVAAPVALEGVAVDDNRLGCLRALPGAALRGPASSGSGSVTTSTKRLLSGDQAKSEMPPFTSVSLNASPPARFRSQICPPARPAVTRRRPGTGCQGSTGRALAVGRVRQLDLPLPIPAHHPDVGVVLVRVLDGAGDRVGDPLPVRRPLRVPDLAEVVEIVHGQGPLRLP
jgi:hypothetical protein